MRKLQKHGSRSSRRNRRGSTSGRAGARARGANRDGDGGSKRSAWIGGKRPILRFVLLFGVFMGVFYSLAMTSTYSQDVLGPYLQVNATVSGSVLRLLGQDVTVVNRSISSSKAALSIEQGCDAIHPSVLFLSAVLAFPVALRRKVGGAVVGVAILLGINLVRIISLFYTQVYFPAAFEIMHVEVWQALFIFLALLCWIIWVGWASRTETPRTGDGASRVPG